MRLGRSARPGYDSADACRRRFGGADRSASAPRRRRRARARAPAVADTQVKKFFTTDGGVKYFDLKEGGGYSPKDGDFVIIEYKSFNSKGQMYDSSDGPGRKPLAAKYKANQILAGWEEALETMREGGTRVLQVPASLAYGDKGVCLENGECLVQPGERLQFELTLKRVAMPPATTRTSRAVSTRSTGVVVHVTHAWPRIGVCEIAGYTGICRVDTARSASATHPTPLAVSARAERGRFLRL